MLHLTIDENCVFHLLFTLVSQGLPKLLQKENSELDILLYIAVEGTLLIASMVLLSKLYSGRDFTFLIFESSVLMYFVMIVGLLTIKQCSRTFYKYLKSNTSFWSRSEPYIGPYQTSK